MPDEIKEGQKEVVEETKPKAEETPEAMSTSKEPTEEPKGDGSELPESVKERTKEQFEKLKAEKDALKKQLDERKQLPSVLDYLSGPVPTVGQEVRQQYVQPAVPQQPIQQPVPSQPATPQLVDPEGYVNADVLKKQLEGVKIALKKAEEAERRAMNAEQRTVRFEQNAETKALYKEYPELDPLSEVFNKEAYDLVKNELTSQIVTSGKRDSMAAAGKMSKYFRTSEKKATSEKVVQQRTQASVPGSAPRQSGTSLADLKSMRGDDAIAERLKRLEAQD